MAYIGKLQLRRAFSLFYLEWVINKYQLIKLDLFFYLSWKATGIRRISVSKGVSVNCQSILLPFTMLIEIVFQSVHQQQSWQLCWDPQPTGWQNISFLIKFPMGVLFCLLAFWLFFFTFVFYFVSFIVWCLVFIPAHIVIQAYFWFHSCCTNIVL